MAPAEAQSLAEAFERDLELKDSVITGLIGPTIGVHVGKGTLAVLLHPKY
jgi:fatty acid-binding protein DegV